MENNALDTHSTPEKIAAIALLIAVLVAPAKLIYYDTGIFNALKWVYPAILTVALAALIIFGEVRRSLYAKWLRLMIYAPVFIIILIVVGVVVYFFQVIFAAGPIDPGSGE